MNEPLKSTTFVYKENGNKEQKMIELFQEILEDLKNIEEKIKTLKDLLRR